MPVNEWWGWYSNHDLRRQKVATSQCHAEVLFWSKSMSVAIDD